MAKKTRMMKKKKGMRKTKRRGGGGSPPPKTPPKTPLQMAEELEEFIAASSLKPPPSPPKSVSSNSSRVTGSVRSNLSSGSSQQLPKPLTASQREKNSARALFGDEMKCSGDNICVSFFEGKKHPKAKNAYCMTSKNNTSPKMTPFAQGVCGVPSE